MSENQPAGQPATPPVKTRNPVERIIVWGLIAGLLVLLGVEANSWYQQKEILTALAAKVKAAEDSAAVATMTEVDVAQAMGGKKPAKTTALKGDSQSPYGAMRIDVYSWFTLSPVNKRDIYVYYGAPGRGAKDHPEVIAIQPDDIVNSPAQPPQVAAGGQPPEGEGGGRGARRGQGGAGNATSDAEQPDADKSDADKSEGDKPEGDKPDADKPDAKKPTEKSPADTDKDSE